MKKTILISIILSAVMTAFTACGSDAGTVAVSETSTEQTVQTTAETTAAQTETEAQTTTATETASETEAETADSEEAIPEENEIEITDELIKETCETIGAYYNDNLDAKGNYIVFDNETEVNGTSADFIVRYQCSDEEAEEIIADGGLPVPNEYVTRVTVDFETGVATDEAGMEFVIDRG